MEENNISGEKKSENLYEYQGEQNNQIIEPDAIRRSIGNNNPNAMENNIINQNKVDNNGAIQPVYWMLYVIFGIIQGIIILLISFYYFWDESNIPKNYTISLFDENKYKIFQDINIVIFIGFAFLRSFLQYYSWTSIALTLISGVFSFEFGLFMLICWAAILRKNWSDGFFNFNHLLDANYCSATVIISLGAIMGKLSLPQYLVTVFIETIFSTLNYVLLRQTLKIIDIGGSLTIHLFGALFGGTFSLVWLIGNGESEKVKKSSYFRPNYFSNIFALFGLLILLTFWPSFNIGLVNEQEGNEQKYDGIINTYFAILGSIVGTFCLSPIFNNGIFKIKDIINSCYSGAIIVAGCCHIIKHYWISIILGIASGALTTFLSNTFTPILNTKIYYNDTADIVFYHGVPGFFGGIVTTIFVRTLGNNQSKKYIYNYIGSLLSSDFSNSEGKINIHKYSATHFFALVITILISIASGFVTGFIIKFCNCKSTSKYFDDHEFFDITESEHFPKENENPENDLK